MAISPVYICIGANAPDGATHEAYPAQTVTTTVLVRDAFGSPVLDENGDPIVDSSKSTTSSVTVTPSLAEWGVAVADYKMDVKVKTVVNGKVTTETKTRQVDFQDLLIVISEQRAAAVEEQIEPMSVRMSTRNRKLDQLGAALSIIADIQAQFTDSNDIGDKTSKATLTTEAKEGLKLVGYTGGTVGSELKLNKSQAEYYQQLLKTELDSLNNASSKDMTRLQSLVDKRDESYSTATSLMQAVADTRANTIKNM